MLIVVAHVGKLDRVLVTLLDQCKTKRLLELRDNGAVCLDDPLLTLINGLGVRQELFADLKQTTTDKVVYAIMLATCLLALFPIYYLPEACSTKPVATCTT